MNSDYEKGKADERAKIMKHLHERVEHCFKEANNKKLSLESQNMFFCKGDEVDRMLNEIRDGKHDQ